MLKNVIDCSRIKGFGRKIFGIFPWRKSKAFSRFSFSPANHFAVEKGPSGFSAAKILTKSRIDLA